MKSVSSHKTGSSSCEEDDEDVMSAITNPELKIIFISLTKRFNKVIESNQFLSAKFDEVNKKVELLEDKIKEQEKQLKKKEENIDELSCELNFLNQYSRKENVEIRGVEKRAEETETELYEKVIQAVRKIGESVPMSEISIAHRLYQRNTNKTPIIVRFKKTENYVIKLLK